jgi:hypothetical protein
MAVLQQETTQAAQEEVPLVAQAAQAAQVAQGQVLAAVLLEALVALAECKTLPQAQAATAKTVVLTVQVQLTHVSQVTQLVGLRQAVLAELAV